MARPRIFVSSTFYDLKHVRASLEVFIESLGYEAVLFEKGDIAFHPDFALDISCYREAETADIFVLIIGGRYGLQASDVSTKDKPKFFDQYKSITEKEFDTAQSADVPTFILIDKSVHAEYQTYLQNKANDKIIYAHVDSANVFRLVENIFARNKNNPVHNFERASDIETWLRDQWSGLFRELLRTRSQQKQLSALNAQVGELQAINETLKNYMEALLGEISPTTSGALIRAEQVKIDKEKQEQIINNNTFFRYVSRTTKLDKSLIRAMIEEAKDASDAIDRYEKLTGSTGHFSILRSDADAQNDFNEFRSALNLPKIDFSNSGARTIQAPSSNKKNNSNRAKRKSSSENTQDE